MTWNARWFRQVFGVLVAGTLAGFIVSTSASHAAVDQFLVQKVETALVADASEATFVPLEDAIRGNRATPEEKRDLLGELARLRDKYGYHGDAAEALAFQADLIARLDGARAPALAAIYAAASDAWLAAGEAGSALDAARLALDMDRTYFACSSGVVARAYSRIAAAYEALGRDADARAAEMLAGDPDARCAEAGGPGGRSVVVTSEFASATADSFAHVKLFYATDRAQTGSQRPNDFYSGERGGMDYGVMEVTVPRSHKPGEVEAPSLLKLEWRENPERHFVITRIETMDDAGMFADMRRTLGERRSDEAFVFVHGFNVSFAQAAKRTAQIAYDLNFEGAPILFSWPSRGSAFAYVRDEAVVRLSGRRLLGFLDDVVVRSGARRINLIAHSMGNRAMIDALELMAVRRAASGRRGPLFEQAIFAAPDEDADLFAEMLQTVRPLARRITLYSSENDVALSASRALHGDRARAGQGGDAILVADGIDSIDMSELGEDMLGHSYFAANASALTDMTWLFWRDFPPDQRCGMDGRAVPEGRFWMFDPLMCDGPVLLSALTLLKTEGAMALKRLERIVARVGASGNREEAEEWQAIHRAASALAGLVR